MYPRAPISVIGAVLWLVLGPVVSASAKDAVQVRFGVHPNFERMVFDWQSPVQYRLEQHGRSVSLTFDAGAKVDLVALRRGLARVAQGISAATYEDRVLITFTLTGDVSIVDSRTGPKVVFDFKHAGGDQVASALAAIAPAAGEAAPGEAAPAKPQQPVGPPRSLLPKTGTTPPGASRTQAAKTAPQRSAVAKGAAPRADAAKTVGQPAAPRSILAPMPPPGPTPTPAPAPVAAAVPPRPSAPPVQPAPPQPPAPAPAVAAAPPPPTDSAPQAAPVEMVDQPASAGSPAETVAPSTDRASARQARVVPPPPAPPPQVPVEIVRTLDGQGLRFGWAEPVGAAVFARGDTLWIVFDHAARLDLSRTDGRRAEITGEIEVASTETAVVRLSPPGGTAATARREGNAWLIDLLGSSRSSALAMPANPLRVSARRGSTPAASALVVDMDGARTILRLVDPDAGDTIFVAPSTLPGAGVTDARSQPEVRLLRTAQGVAVLPLADGVQVQALGTTVEVSAARGISISPDLATDAPVRPVRPANAGERLFDLAQWRRGGPDRFTAERRALQDAIAAAPQAERNARRLELARLYFANGMWIDSQGQLQLVQQDDPDLAAVAPIKALRAATALMSGDIQGAREINSPALDGQPEANFWRGALAIAEGEPLRAAGMFAGIPDFSMNYPPPLANRLGLMVAEAKVAVKDYGAAQNRINTIDASSPTVGEAAEAAYLRGKVLAGIGKVDDAIKLWQSVETRSYAPARLSATLARVDAELAKKSTTPRQAIEALDRLRFSWRGDRYEYAVLERLGRLQIDSGDIRAGLRTLRQAVTYFAEERDTKDLIAVMSAAFERFFLSPQTLKLVPIVSVGVFEEFRELTPPGARGDAIMNRLVDHMLTMDLLDRAGDLLDHLVKHRFTGADKSAAGAKLALVRLLDRDAAGALEALDGSVAAEASPELQVERSRLAARALSDLDRPVEALQRLTDDQGDQAKLLRVEIQWRAKSWAQAAIVLGQLAGEPPAGKEAMPDEQSRRVVRLATALALAGDDSALEDLREKFGPAIDRGPFKAVFGTITSTKGSKPTEMAELAAQISAATPIQSFLKDYRAQIAAPRKSAQPNG